MKQTLLYMAGLFGVLFLHVACSDYGRQPADVCNHRLYYTEPAKTWEATLPLGNGRLGLMTDGNIGEEHLVLNEISLWSGGCYDYSNPEASKTLPRIQQLLFEGRNIEAQELMYRSFVPKKAENGGTYGSYQVLGSLDLFFPGQPVDTLAGVTDYERSLSLRDGVAVTGYTFDGVRYEREYFVSREKDVMAVHLKASQKGALAFRAALSRQERCTVTTAGSDVLLMEGTLDSGQPGVDGMKYRVAMRLLSKDGTSSLSADEGIQLTDGQEAWLVLSATTNYEACGTDFPGARYKEVCDSLLDEAVKQPDSLEPGHIQAHRSLYDRVSLTLPATPNDQLPTDERVLYFSSIDSPAMAALYYNFGRYLLISSTRPGSLPPNLQGLWANTIQTPWNGDYHTNINVQMNHWPLEQAGLGELYGPLISLMERSIENGEKTAKVFYGDKAQGWVMHMMTNVWNYTDPGEHPSWGATNTGGAWMCAHLWEHYLYTGDTDYLKRIYPIMKGASEFFHSTTVAEPVHGWLVTAPTSSPENAFFQPGDKSRKPVSICMGPTMDVQLLTELYTNVIEAARILGVDADYVATLEADLKRFPPMQISPNGYLQEWLEDYEEVEVNHRHVSHLYGLHPSNLISPESTPDLADACRVTLNRRGDEATGWSRAWKMNFWARLGDGNRAYKLFKSLLNPVYDGKPGVDYGSKKSRGGTYPNLFCAHPPFQIDGNYGGAAGVAEMLLQSHMGFVKLLPALPDSWSEGSFRGMKVRGGVSVDLVWAGGRAQEAVFLAERDVTLKLLLPPTASQIAIKGRSHNKVLEPVVGNTIYELNLKAGESLKVTFIHNT